MGEIAEGMDIKGVFPDINAALPVMYREKLIYFLVSLLKCNSWKYEWTIALKKQNLYKEPDMTTGTSRCFLSSIK